MPVIGVDVVAKNIKSFGGGFIKHVDKTMDKARDVLSAEITKNMSNTDYSLEDLAAMGHPYAKRHGPRGIQIHDPYWTVHTHSGQLLSSKIEGTEETKIQFGKLIAKAWVGLDPSKAAHAISVIYGTSKMIPRDFLEGSLVLKQSEILKILKTNLKDFVFHFKSEGTLI